MKRFIQPSITKGISATGARTNTATRAETTNATRYPYWPWTQCHSSKWPLSEPIAERGLPQPSAKMPEQAVEPRRSTRWRAEPSWFKDCVTWKIDPSWLIKTMLRKGLVDFDQGTFCQEFEETTPWTLSTYYLLKLLIGVLQFWLKVFIVIDFRLCLLFHFKKGGDVVIVYWAAWVIDACNALYMWASVRIQYGRLKRVVSWVYNPPPSRTGLAFRHYNY